MLFEDQQYNSMKFLFEKKNYIYSNQNDPLILVIHHFFIDLSEYFINTNPPIYRPFSRIKCLFSLKICREYSRNLTESLTNLWLLKYAWLQTCSITNFNFIISVYWNDHYIFYFLSSKPMKRWSFLFSTNYIR